LKRKSIIPLFLFTIILINGFSQNNLIVHQIGGGEKEINSLAILGHQEIIPKKINDSTWDYELNLTKPEFLFLYIDYPSGWEERVWFNPTYKLREIYVDYSNKTIKVSSVKKSEKQINKEFPVNIKVEPDPNEWDKIIKVTHKLQKSGAYGEEEKIEASFIEMYPNSYEALWFFTHSAGIYAMEHSRKLTLFKKLGSALSIYPEYRQAKADLFNRQYPQKGDEFCEFKLKDRNQKLFDSKTVSGKWILLHFWMNGCAASKNSLKPLNDCYQSVDTSKINFISVSIEHQKKDWLNFPNNSLIIWKSVWEEDNFFGKLCLQYNVFAMPFFILFNNEKKIVEIWDGDEVAKITEKLIEENLIRSKKNDD
jgi:hypothetical protein